VSLGNKSKRGAMRVRSESIKCSIIGCSSSCTRECLVRNPVHLRGGSRNGQEQ